MPVPSYLSLIRPYIARYRGYFIWGLVVIAATNALGLVTPLILRSAINRIEEGTTTGRLMVDAALIVGLALCAGLFHYYMRRTVIWASRKIEFDLRGDLFAHILTLDGPFFDRMPTGDIITRASSDIEQVRQLVGPGIMQGVNTLIMAGVAIPLMIVLDWRLAVYVLVPLPFLAYFTHVLGQVAHRRFLAIQERFSELSAAVQETLAGIRVIKTHVREAEKRDEFSKDNWDYFRLNMHLIRLWGGFYPLLSALSSSAVLLVLYFGGRRVIAGEIDLGTFIAFTVYLSMLIWPMIALGWVVSLYQRGTASLKRLAEIFDTKPAVSIPPSHTVRSLPEIGDLEMRHLTFSYNGNGNGQQALKDISFVIRPGETVAIAGPTGCGKSTIAHLLWRRYAVPEGTMLWGGIDAGQTTLEDWRRRIVVVPQEPFLFSDTLRANIGLAVDTLEEDRLQEVGELAALNKDVAEFPRAYDTVVGERGITLSGGQKQRATLARALVAPASVLILDDAFSAVDAQTEEEILSRLDAIFGTRTIVLITHRISTLRRADRILFLEEGRLTDAGTHDDLMERGGPYARWATREALKEKLETL
ncbi:MAG: ABC transporter ATP-binding protein [Candidatus Zixiibacteriota bacterium]